MTSALLEVNGVTLQYKAPRHLVTAIYRVDFSVHQGDRYVILGPSGCGKSTLLKAIGGFMPPAEGSIRIHGREVTSPGPDRMMVFQEFEQLMPWKSVYQNVLFPMKVTRKFASREAAVRADAIVDKVGLTKFRDVYPHMLSGGMKMRVAIARAMALEPDIFLMDEPFAALDALTRHAMQEELLSLWNQLGFTVLFVTHSIEEAIIIGSRIWYYPHIPVASEPSSMLIVSTIKASVRPSSAYCQAAFIHCCSDSRTLCTPERKPARERSPVERTCAGISPGI